MPNNQSSEKLFDYDEAAYMTEGFENNAAMEEFNNTNNTNTTEDNDFSEYLWMENIEEFDKEVMQRLEEEALMEECIEAMLADESSEIANNLDPNPDVSNMINNLKLDADNVAKSNLNPLAAEFIPGASTQFNQPPAVLPSSGPLPSGQNQTIQNIHPIPALPALQALQGLPNFPSLPSLNGSS